MSKSFVTRFFAICTGTSPKPPSFSGIDSAVIDHIVESLVSGLTLAWFFPLLIKVLAASSSQVITFLGNSIGVPSFERFLVSFIPSLYAMSLSNIPLPSAWTLGIPPRVSSIDVKWRS